eukprot:TRINITY_DN51560_c0_g1_i1.p1 TRINITY_DN51560_c0_g1~~TRINITY_DN51560_c0_g1_i1.p1  ORF type:complete len:188 (+),score=17.34 TRINITY_DN51560_c0_g1_i1:36-599(+)
MCCFQDLLRWWDPPRGWCDICREETVLFSYRDHQCEAAKFCRKCIVLAVHSDIDSRSLPLSCPGCRKHDLGERELHRIIDDTHRRRLQTAARHQVEVLLVPVVKLVEMYPSVGSLEDLRRTMRPPPSSSGDPTMDEYMTMRGLQRCPQCGSAVEKASGCNFIRCRCGCGFCFRCGRRGSCLAHASFT